MNNTIPQGLAFLSVLCSLGCWFFFKNKTLGLFDPLLIFIFMRMGPMLTSIILFWLFSELNYKLIIFTISVIAFICSLYLTTPKIKFCPQILVESELVFLKKLAIFLFATKILILFYSSGTLPIFSEGGSDAYIEFDMENKLGSSFLLAISMGDLIILSFLIPLIKKRQTKFFLFLMFAFTVLLGGVNGKKSSMLSVFSSIALGEYLRISFLANQKKYFISFRNTIISILISLIWATNVYLHTADISLKSISIENIFFSLDVTMYQWFYPYQLFVSGELDHFFNSYQVNVLTYFFHSILVPLGIPSFTSSIGPSIHEYLTGSLTGHGINPTFVLEGYVLCGIALPLYAAMCGYAIGKLRYYIMHLKHIEYKLALSALLLSKLDVIALDGLLFAKIFYVVLFLFITIILPLRGLCHASKRFI